MTSESDTTGHASGVAEPRWKWVAKRGGQILVLWSHGRITLHPREGAKPATTIAKHGDWHAASTYAKRNGFELVGLVEPRSKEDSVAVVEQREPVAASNDVVAPAAATNGAAGSDGPKRAKRGRATPSKRGELAPETYERAKKAQKFIDKGLSREAAFRAVAREEGDESAWGAVHGAYYQVRKRRGGEAPKVVVERRWRAILARVEAGEDELAVIREVAKREGLKPDGLASHFRKWRRAQPVARPAAPPPAPPKPEEPTPPPLRAVPAESRQEQPLTHPRDDAERAAREARQAIRDAALRGRERPLGVSAVEDEETDPLREADSLARQRIDLFEREYEAIKSAHAALNREVDAILERMGKLEEREEQLRKGAAFFGISFAPVVPEAT